MIQQITLATAWRTDWRGLREDEGRPVEGDWHGLNQSLGDSLDQVSLETEGEAGSQLAPGVNGGAVLRGRGNQRELHWMGTNHEFGAGYAEFEESGLQPRDSQDVPLAPQARSDLQLELWASWAYQQLLLGHG